MKDKPIACQSCPLYGDGMGWVGPKYADGAEVLVIGMFPSIYEAMKGEPRVGMNVDAYASQYERYAGALEMSYDNVIRCRGARGTTLPTGKTLHEAVRCCRQYDDVPASVRLVVFQGFDVAKHLVPQLPTPEKWRGFLLPKGESSVG